jgi:hypothetical protein
MSGLTKSDRTNLLSEAAVQMAKHRRCRTAASGPSVLVPPPATESAFHIVGFALNFRSVIFPPLENMFYIAKIATYLIEK